MISIAIVYHAGLGDTETQALAVAQGAASIEDTIVRLLSTDETDERWAELDEADAIIFGAPTSMGSASSPYKAFMEASATAWLEQRWKDKIAAGFTSSGPRDGDKPNTLAQLASFAAQHGMIWVGLGLMPGGGSRWSRAHDVNRLGGFLGAIAQAEPEEACKRCPRLFAAYAKLTGCCPLFR